MCVVASEEEVLKLIKEDKESNTTIISQKMRISTEYAHLLCDSLHRGGYLERTGMGRYKLTEKGEKVLNL